MSYKNQRAQYEIIADEMELAILNDTAGFEEKLPSEQFLAETFSVSRPVIREALKILKERGLIETHQGAPTYITKPGVKNLTENIGRIATAQSITPEQIYQLRIILEAYASGLAAGCATEADVDDMKELNKKRFDAIGDAKKCAKYDIEFHAAIVRAAGNPLLEMMHASLSTLLLRILERIMENESFASDGEAFNKQIIDAIESNDVERATELTKAHLLVSAKNYELTER